MRVNGRYCYCCENTKQHNQFFKYPLMKNNGFLPICKSCCNEKIKQYKEILGNDGAALWCMLAELGIPFKKDVWFSIQDFFIKEKTQGRKPELLTMYLRYFVEHGVIAYGFWDSDTMLTAFYGEEDKKEVEEENILDINKQVKKWGKYEIDGIPDEDSYKFLNDLFGKYTKDLSDMDVNLENRYRDLCKAELRLRRANEKGDISEIKNAQDILNKQLNLLGLNDVKKQVLDERRQFIDRIAWMIEETEPAEEEDREKYSDIAGYEKIYNSWMRSMQNILTGTRDFPDIPKGVV